jgi:hypothetical protein
MVTRPDLGEPSHGVCARGASRSLLPLLAPHVVFPRPYREDGRYDGRDNVDPELPGD